MTLREIQSHISRCKEFVPEKDWERFLDQQIFVMATPGVSPSGYEMAGLCGQFLEFGVELVIQPAFEQK